MAKPRLYGEPVATVTVGKTVINGTEWPLTNQVLRGPDGWDVVFHVANGIGMDSRSYRTKREAFQAAGIK